MRDGYVYFLQGFGGGPIKIGYSANPRGRFRAIQGSNPEPLDLVATIPGSRNSEREWHEMFSADRLHGEWFKPSRSLCAVIEALVNPDLGDPNHVEIHRLINLIQKRRQLRREHQEGSV